jgi:hypothetical protein
VSKRPDVSWSEAAKRYADRINEHQRQRTLDDFVLPSPTRMRKMTPAEREQALLTALCRPKGPKDRKREARIAADRAAIAAMAKELKEQGVRNAKSLAEQKVAERQNVTIAALRKRRYRKK